jgi:hypothetical protein
MTTTTPRTQRPMPPVGMARALEAVTQKGTLWHTATTLDELHTLLKRDARTATYPGTLVRTVAKDSASRSGKCFAVYGCD